MDFLLQQTWHDKYRTLTSKWRKKKRQKKKKEANQDATTQTIRQCSRLPVTPLAQNKVDTNFVLCSEGSVKRGKTFLKKKTDKFDRSGGKQDSQYANSDANRGIERKTHAINKVCIDGKKQS
jgi:hypothetical protein